MYSDVQRIRSLNAGPNDDELSKMGIYLSTLLVAEADPRPYTMLHILNNRSRVSPRRAIENRSRGSSVFTAAAGPRGSERPTVGEHPFNRREIHEGHRCGSRTHGFLWSAKILPARPLLPSENNVRSVCSRIAAFRATGFPYCAFLPVPVSSSRCVMSLSGMTTTVQGASRASMWTRHLIVCEAPA